MSDVSCNLDLDEPGHHTGYIQVPSTTDTSGWRNELIPIVTFGSPDRGRRVLVLAGTHGDEHEGQFAAHRLLREVRDDEVDGQLIIVPYLSGPAVKIGRRHWPDGSNMNRVFPGDPQGSPAGRLANFLTKELFTRSDVVYDLHSGGRTTHVYPMSHMRRVDDPEQGRAMLAAMKAWNSDFHMLYINVAGTGLLPDTAADMGKLVVTTELGGGGYIPPVLNSFAIDGLKNSLRQVGVLAGAVVDRSDLGLPPAKILSALDPANYMFAPASGLVQLAVAAGDEVSAGDLVAEIHSTERPWAPAVELRAPNAGIVCATRAITVTEQGDMVVVLGQVIDEGDIW
ncbi:MAG: succinylglutamate desuccinylase/aspartoacylase family protein [Acidimicrobiia bacterium]|nr:succinylglutamate desuccinylase/aspartoacylase family protein [Acidimicrobiia bacterium]